MKTQTHAAHHLIAVFADDETAGEAVDALGKAGIPTERLSVVGRHGEGETGDEGAVVSNQMLVGGAKGSAVGALAGIAAGALVLAVPGVGAVL
jgi:hypothetical protein